MKSRPQHLAAVVLVPAVFLSCAEEECFVAGTLIATPDGPRAIETLRPGDVVWSFSIERRERVARPVRSSLRKLARELRTITADGRVIRGVTPEHPFFDDARASYRKVRDLVAGDTLAAWSDDGGIRPCRIDGVACEEAASPSIEVYNLTIDGAEANYFAEGLLVHNKSPPASFCSAGIAFISEHRDAVQDVVVPGVYDVKWPSWPAEDVSIAVRRRVPGAWVAEPSVAERLDIDHHQVRILMPQAFAHYEVSASGWFFVEGQRCVANGRLEFAILSLGMADASADASSPDAPSASDDASPDAGSSDSDDRADAPEGGSSPDSDDRADSPGVDGGSDAPEVDGPAASG